jgi:hypothetical protein
VFQIIFKSGHALLLVGTRFLAPRNNRGIAGQQPLIVHNGLTFPRTFHSHGISTFIPRTRFIHEPKLSTATLIPRSFHFHNSFMPMSFPWSRSFHRQSTVRAWQTARFIVALTWGLIALTLALLIFTAHSYNDSYKTAQSSNLTH